ncbi:MAG: FHA domain-containing protein [Nitriliruptoraceae bacterium]|nr:FHA domain-containing protein [Nitriliruptoraceae bacterium]
MIELKLRVELEDGRSADLDARLTEQHRIAELGTALARHLGMPVPQGHDPKVRCVRRGVQLDPQRTVVGSGLVSGDHVQLGLTYLDVAGQGMAGQSGLFCEVISGPSSGISTRLHAGRLTIGRDPDCDLTLVDPTVSKRHVELIVDSAGNVEVGPLPDVTNAVVLDGAVVTELTAVPRDTVLELGSSQLVVRAHDVEHATVRDRLGQIPFNRTPYRHPDLSEVEVRGPGRPPAPYEPRPLMVLAMLAPAAAGVAFALILQRPIFLLFALLSPISMLGNWVSERRRGGATHKQQVETFERRLADWQRRFDEALTEERRRRFAAAPDIVELARRAELRTPELWGRSHDDEGFLTLRLGLGDAPALTTTPMPGGVDDDPDQRIEAIIEQRRLLPSVPITVGLPDRGVLALVGDSHEVETALSSLLLQTAVLHSPDDVVLCGALDRRRTLSDWFKWLPHASSMVSPLPGEHVGHGTEFADDLLQRLVEVVAAGPDRVGPTVVLLLDELTDADRVLVASLLEHGPAARVYTVWVGSTRQLVPRQARAILDCPALDAGQRAELWTVDATEPIVELAPDRLSLEAAPRLARLLAPVRDTSSAAAAASIPRVAPLLETLGSTHLDANEVARRWQTVKPYGLAAPIGMGPDGPFWIDLVDHGPHALIAGTSGAGKSELLQSMIAALIAEHPPTRLNLLFIDYKGGASSNLFQPAPHTVGYVTNLSADLAMRALVSLRAELDHRMRLMEGRAKDLEEMLEKHPDEAPPSLVIVVDEFATLVKEIPDFVAGMVDVAQRGRSLGIHLILATQRPTGAVNDNILANTNLRISLRVLDPQDSSSILGSADAAAIPAPLRGRGYAKLGAGGLIEFQSAYSGAPQAVAGGITPLEVNDFPTSDHTTLVPQPPPKADDDEQATRTHLDVVIEAIVGATEALGHRRGRRPWLEDLPEFLTLQSVLDGEFGPLPQRVPGRDVILGIADLPERQAQEPATLDLEDRGGILVFGTGGSGRTTTLRSLLGSAIVDVGPDEVEIHVLDFAGRGLEALRDLPHVAAVAAADDLEQATRILMHLRAEVTRRQTLLAEHRAEDLTALHTLGVREGLPRLLLVLDGYETFERTFERGSLYIWSELLAEVVLAGRAAGVHLLASADRRIGIPAAITNAVGGRLILRTSDTDALVDLGIPSGVAKDARLGDGRALLASGTTVQVPVVGEDVTASAQADALDKLARQTAAGRQAALPRLPDRIGPGELPPVDTDRMTAVLGLADLTGDTVTAPLHRSHLTVIGPPESGRSTALARGARSLMDAGGAVWALGDPDSPVGALPLPADRLASTKDDHAPLLDAVLAAAGAPAAPLQLVVVDRAEQLSPKAGLALEAAIDHDRIRVLAGFDGATMTSFSATPWQSSFKRARQLLLLQPDDLGDLTSLTPVNPRLRPNQAFPAGRGILVSGRTWALVQVAIDPELG